MATGAPPSSCGSKGGLPSAPTGGSGTDPAWLAQAGDSLAWYRGLGHVLLPDPLAAAGNVIRHRSPSMPARPRVQGGQAGTWSYTGPCIQATSVGMLPDLGPGQHLGGRWGAAGSAAPAGGFPLQGSVLGGCWPVRKAALRRWGPATLQGRSFCRLQPPLQLQLHRVTP